MPSAGARVGVVSSGSPELAQLAMALADEGLLQRYATGFSLPGDSSAGWFLRRLYKMPRLGTVLRRREVPHRIPARALRSPALGIEFLRGLLGPRWVEFDGRALGRRNRVLRRAAARYANELDVLVISHELAFELPEPGRRRARVVLNMPTVDPGFRNDQVNALAEAHPDLADIVPAGYSIESMLQRRREYHVADAILVGSEFVAGTLRAAGVASDQIHVVPYGAPGGEFQQAMGANSVRADPLQVLCVATVTPLKGVRELTDACALLPDELIDLRLVGGAPHGLDWLGDGARFYRGRVEHNAIPSVMREASVLVLASWFEGLPHVVLEGMASGLPCIVTPRGADQVVRDGVEGFIVPVNDPPAIAAALRRLAEDPELLVRMGRAARARAEEFTWQHYSQHCLRVITQLTQSEGND